MAAWISVKDRLPEIVAINGEPINFLVYIPGYGLDIGNYEPDSRTWRCFGLPAGVTY